MAISRTQMGSQLRGNRVKKSKSGKLSDLTGDGKVTQADVLKGRGVFKKGGKVGYHRMPDGTMMQDSEHNMKKGGNVRKYQAGGKASKKSMKKDRPKPYDEMSTTGALSRVTDVPRSLRPIARPERKGAATEGPNPVKRSIRPIARPERDPSMSPDNPVGRGNRESMREAMEMPEMKEGGKVRGYGKARGGKACKMM